MHTACRRNSAAAAQLREISALAHEFGVKSQAGVLATFAAQLVESLLVVMIADHAPAFYCV